MECLVRNRKQEILQVLFTVTAEVNPAATYKRHEQGWVDEVITNLDELVARVREAKENKEAVSIAYDGNVVDVWEKFDQENL